MYIRSNFAAPSSIFRVTVINSFTEVAKDKVQFRSCGVLLPYKQILQAKFCIDPWCEI